MTARLLLAPCCHDTIALDPPETEYLMVMQQMSVELPEAKGPHSVMGGPLEGKSFQAGELHEPYVSTVKVEVPYHVACLRAGRGMKNGVQYEQVSIPGPLGTRRLAKRSELEEV